MGRFDKIKETSRDMQHRLEQWPKWLRIPAGVLLVIAGILGFLPILGFWMVPLGLAILAIDIPIVRRGYRKGQLAIADWRRKRRQRQSEDGPS